jgi:hypothetical protein
MNKLNTILLHYHLTLRPCVIPLKGSNFPSPPVLLAVVIAVAATIGATVRFCFSFFASLFNLPFAFYLFFSLSITSLHGIGQHSSRYSFRTRGRYLDQSSTCLISCRPGFVAYSGVGSSRRILFCCSPVTLHFPRPSWAVSAPTTLM